IVPDPDVGRGNFLNSLVYRLRSRHILKGEVVREPLEIDVPLESSYGEQTFQFTTEVERISILPIVVGFDPKPVSSEQQLLLAIVPDGKGKHSTKMGDEVFTELFIEMNQTLSIGGGHQSMSTLCKIPSQFSKIVNLPIEYNPDRLVLVVDRLSPSLHVDNGKPSHTQAHSISKIEPVVIGTSSCDERAHASDQGLVDRSDFCIDRSDNATHVQNLSDSPAAKRWQRGTFAPSAAG